MRCFFIYLLPIFHPLNAITAATTPTTRLIQRGISYVPIIMSHDFKNRSKCSAAASPKIIAARLKKSFLFIVIIFILLNLSTNIFSIAIKEPASLLYENSLTNNDKIYFP